jgi:hypothetical protein
MLPDGRSLATLSTYAAMASKHVCVISKYEVLTTYLQDRPEPVVELSFSALDRLVGGLPDSARRHQAWWSNSRASQPHSRFWLDAGRRAQPNFNAGLVRFTIGSEAPHGPRTSSSRPPHRRSRTAASPPVASLDPTGESVSASITFEWLSGGALTLVDGKLAFPGMPSSPAVYRFALGDLTGPDRHYVGESENLARRMGNYRHPAPTQPTNQRLHKRIVDTIAGGGQVHLAVVLTAELDGEALDLRSKAARRLVENAALLRLSLDGLETENL